MRTVLERVFWESLDEIKFLGDLKICIMHISEGKIFQAVGKTDGSMADILRKSLALGQNKRERVKGKTLDPSELLTVI